MDIGIRVKDPLPEKISLILILIFLFSINFSIALCYIVFTLLIISSGISYFKCDRKIVLPPYFKYIILFSVFTLISTVFSIDRTSSFKENKEIFIFLLIPIFILILKRTEMYRSAVFTILYSAFLSSLIGIIISIREGISLNHRLKGFSSHWMTYSGLLMLVFVFFIILTIYEKNKKSKIHNIILLTPVLVSIFLSLTRSAWIGLFISTGIFFLYYFRKHPRVLFISFIILALVFMLLPGSIKSRVFSIFDINNITNLDRLHMAYTTIEIIKDHPLTGVGPDNVKKIYSEYRHPEATNNNPHLHNNFFQIAAERGLPTLLIFIFLFVSIFKDLSHKIRKGNLIKRRISTAVLFLVISFLTSGMFEYNFGDTEIKFLFLFFISIPYLDIDHA